MKESLAFDDVLLEPCYSDVLPTDVNPAGQFSTNVCLNIPIVSAAMDTVSEHDMAIAMAQAGGLAVIHKNCSPQEQAEQVRRVKRYEAGMVVNPVTIGPEETLADVRRIMQQHDISGIPVVDPQTEKLLGVITYRDVRFATDPRLRVYELMTFENLITVRGDVSQDEAKHLLHTHRIEKLLVVDDAQRCVGLITFKDIDRAESNPLANKDLQGRLRVGAAVGVGQTNQDRVLQLIDAGVDVVVVDTAHGHSKGVGDMVTWIKAQNLPVDVIAGNIATSAAARFLIDLGVDGIKCGMGPGAICTTRVVAGIGVPQFSAIQDAAEICLKNKVPLIADGGIRSSGDAVKALAAGASCVMMGSMLAGTNESPGETFVYQGRAYKSYRGMGSLAAMAQGSADRYNQQGQSITKMVPEGVEARVPARGPVNLVLHQLVGGIRSGMGYVGAATLTELQSKASFRRITGAGLAESRVHDVSIVKSAPNYWED